MLLVWPLHTLYNTGMALITAGQRFGRWTILEDQQYTFVKKVSAKCSCGSKVTKVRVGNLTGGRTKSCGCINSENLAQQGRKRTKYPVNPGDVYGRLTVVDATNREKVETLCECGGTKVTRASNLYQGNTRSCGCLKIEVATQLGKSTAIRGGLSGHTLYGTWERIVRGTIPMHEPWRNDLPLFVKDVEAEIGPRPAGLRMMRKDLGVGFIPGNLTWAAGSANPLQRVVLSKEQREEIVVLVHGGAVQCRVAQQYGVSPSLVSSIYKEYKYRER